MVLRRTQVLLEDRQLERLRREAAAEHVSISALLRRLIDRELKATEGPSLASVKGMFSDGTWTEEDIDKELYG